MTDERPTRSEVEQAIEWLVRPPCSKCENLMNLEGEMEARNGRFFVWHCRQCHQKDVYIQRES
jgi:hypothetical protein